MAGEVGSALLWNGTREASFLEEFCEHQQLSGVKHVLRPHVPCPNPTCSMQLLCAAGHNRTELTPLPGTETQTASTLLSVCQAGR